MSLLKHLDDADRPLVVTDTETTGTSARNNRIIEIGAIRIDPNGDRTSFDRLINPGRAVPRRITRITGITTSMVVGKPPAADVLPEYLAFLGDGILVAHNLRFDESFLNAELQKAGLSSLKNPGLCTLRLARRLLPGLHSKSLANLARFFKIPSHGRHRALRDVEITVQVLERLLRIADYDHGIRSMEKLLKLQSKTYARVNPVARHVDRIRNEILPGLPHMPGVYRMLSHGGDVLYIGKARDLSKRVRSYFNAIEAHPPRIRELISRVRDIEWTVVDTELEALIQESRQIKEERPSFNRALKRFSARPFLRLDTDQIFPRLTAQVISREDGAEYFGPLRSRGEARTVLAICERYFQIRNCDQTQFDEGKRCMRADIGRCPAPCEYVEFEKGDHDPGKKDLVQCYTEIIEEVRLFLDGDIDGVVDSISRDMERASIDMEFEKAATFRDWITLLNSRVQKTGAVATPVDGPDRLLVHRQGESATVVLVRRGRVVAVESVGQLELEAAIAKMIDDDPSPELGLDRISADARRIVESWAAECGDQLATVERRPNEAGPDFVRRAAAEMMSG